VILQKKKTVLPKYKN